MDNIQICARNQYIVQKTLCIHGAGNVVEYIGI